jgi:hypothetical protein
MRALALAHTGPRLVASRGHPRAIAKRRYAAGDLGDDCVCCGLCPLLVCRPTARVLPLELDVPPVLRRGADYTKLMPKQGARAQREVSFSPAERSVKVRPKAKARIGPLRVSCLVASFLSCILPTGAPQCVANRPACAVLSTDPMALHARGRVPLGSTR